MASSKGNLFDKKEPLPLKEMASTKKNNFQLKGAIFS